MGDIYKQTYFYSCNCLFDICLLSYSKKENFKQLSDRIRIYCDRKYQRDVKRVLCTCSNCKEPYRHVSWILKETNFEYLDTNIYVVCRHYLKYILADLFLCDFQERKMNQACLERRTFPQCVGCHPCCYNYYRSGLLNPEKFCINCKIFLASLADFKLNKIFLIK